MLRAEPLRQPIMQTYPDPSIRQDWWNFPGLCQRTYTLYSHFYSTKAKKEGTDYTQGFSISISTGGGLTPDESDFGINASIANTFTVSNSTEWDGAITAINAGGDNKNYIINVVGDFASLGNEY